MAQVNSSRTPRRQGPDRRRRGNAVRLALIGFLGGVGFVAGFILLWALGSVIVGGPGFPWKSTKAATVTHVVMPVSVQADYSVQPLMDLVSLRDLSYVPVKGVYVSTSSTPGSKMFTSLLNLADQTEINAFVVDVKDDSGKITYEANVPLAKQLGLIQRRIRDIDGFLATLQQHHIIPIARVVCFKDNSLALARPDLAIQSSDGGLWADWKKLHYTNPYNHEVWEYIVDVAEDAARHGFREIQFDYVRFPTDGPISKARYPGEYCSKPDCIAGFLAFARERLEKMGVWVSADVFGIVLMGVTHDTDTIGQQIDKVAENVDIVCPMVYPSHYSNGSYGIDSPNADPYDLITDAMKDAAKRMGGTGAMCRPWLQDFSLGITYGVQQVKEQIKAAENQGYTEWILWDPALTYTVKALRADTSSPTS